MSELLNDSLESEVVVGEVVEDTQSPNIEAIEPETQEPVKEDKVPLATLLEEKKRRKELEKKLRQLEEKELENDIVQTRQQIKQKYVAKGYDEDLADMLADDIASVKSEVKRSRFKETIDNAIDEDINDLARDSYYSDAVAYKKEIQAKINEAQKKGFELSIEDAYHLVRGRNKIKETREDAEQKALLKRREEATPSKTPNATGSSPKNPYPLDDTDKKALANLQRMQPNAGWTQEKYYKLMKG